jgi:glycosyltransferase involved in cell wall biosynthesis
MGIIRWLRISAALAEFGHEVDVACGRVPWRPAVEAPGAPRVRVVPLTGRRWSRYDAVKTLFHRGFETLSRFGGGRHPWIVSKLGSVVAERDSPGIFFYGAQRERLYRIQQRIAQSARHVTLLTPSAKTLFSEAHARDHGLLLVPGAAEATIPPPGRDPYPDDGRPRVVFLGNFYSSHPRSQPEAHRTITAKLNDLGRRLTANGVALYVVGPGEASNLDPEAVGYLGAVTYEESWQYMHHADVGLVVSAGDFMHNNESTKLYYYLRTGLPVVSESGFPNDRIVDEAELGFRVPPGDIDRLAARVREALDTTWDRERAVNYILENHTWERRADVYHRLLKESFG